MTLVERAHVPAGFATRLAEAAGRAGPAQQELGSAFQKKLFAGGDTVAGPRYAVIETKHDEVVTPYANAFLSGATSPTSLVQNQCPADPVGHIGMFKDSPALQNVVNQLGHAEPVVRRLVHEIRPGALGGSTIQAAAAQALHWPRAAAGQP